MTISGLALRSGNSPPATVASSRLLDCEDEFLDLANAIKIAKFMEASSAVEDGPYDLSLVEGSITTSTMLSAFARYVGNRNTSSLSAPVPRTAAFRLCGISPT